jgi:tyrosyl-tRNA synthetase
MKNMAKSEQARLELITRNAEEILTLEELRVLVKSNKRLSAYYGTAPTGPVHLGYLIPLSKVFDFGKAGMETKILLADLHAMLDDRKSKWEELDRKVEYYKKCMELAFDWERVPVFVRGSSFQLSKEYMTDVLKIASMATVNRATRAASEVTRMKEPKVGELIYPIMQALDEQYLNVDVQLGGIDQRHIMAFAREYLELVGYSKRVEVMTPIMVSLQGPGAKMSASSPLTHIKVYESEESIRSKINRAYCPEGVVKDNPILQISRFLIFGTESSMLIERDSKFGGDLKVKSYEELEDKFKDRKLHPADLKRAVAEHLIGSFDKARAYFESNRDMLAELGENFLP